MSLSRARLILLVATCFLSLGGCYKAGGPSSVDDMKVVSVIQTSIVVDADQVQADLTRNPLGININFLTDDDTMRSPVRPLQDALQEMGVRYLRFPGGEDSDSYLWSVPPFATSNPALARTGPAEWPASDKRFTLSDQKTLKNTLDFDEFMAVAKQSGAEPVLVVCYDSMYKPPQHGGTAPTRGQLLETAVQWVRYANITKGYAIKYWEIGNETYLDSNNGGATASQYALDLREFSDEMKAVDPTIKIGANGLDTAWWRTILTIAAEKIDFLSVHVYPVWAWGSYDYYRDRTLDFTEPVIEAIRAIDDYASVPERHRLRVAVTEANILDWSPHHTWANVNDLGHALVIFDLFGQLLALPKIEFVQFWTTRWVDNHFPPAIFDALDAKNSLNPAGRALAIWGQRSGKRLVTAISREPIRAYASYTSEEDRLTVFLLNKETTVQTVSITAVRPLSSTLLERWVFKGTGPTDLNPIWIQVPDVGVANPILVNLDPNSITILSERPSALSGNDALRH